MGPVVFGKVEPPTGTTPSFRPGGTGLRPAKFPLPPPSLDALNRARDGGHVGALPAVDQGSIGPYLPGREGFRPRKCRVFAPLHGAKLGHDQGTTGKES